MAVTMFYLRELQFFFFLLLFFCFWRFGGENGKNRATADGRRKAAEKDQLFPPISPIPIRISHFALH